MSNIAKRQRYLQKRLRVRTLHQKGLTVYEIAKETNFPKEKVLTILKDANLKPRYKSVTKEPHAFASHCGKRVKI